MPTTITAVIIFALVLLPGLTYTHEIERIKATAKLSVFRETSLVIAVSTVCLLGAALAILFVSILNREIGATIDKYLRSPEAFLTSHPRLALAALIIYLSASSLLAAIAARRNLWGRFMSKVAGQAHLLQETGWLFALTYKDDMTKFHAKVATRAHVYLKDGTIVRGQLFGRTVSAEEDQQASLTLGQPLSRVNIYGKPHMIRNVQRVVIHATEIKFVGFKTMEREEPTEI